MSPEHLHLAFNHLPFLGLGLALVPLLIGIFGRSRPALASGLLLAAVCGWSVILVMETGEEAYDRYEHASRHGIALDADVKQWVEAHEQDAESLSFLMYATGAVATIALLLSVVRVGGAFVLGWIVVLLCIASLAAGIVIADSGGKIRRPDFRADTRPASFLEQLPHQPHCGFDILA